MVYLEAAGGTAGKDDVLHRVELLLPPEGEELELVMNGSTKWVNALMWQTTGFVKAGWMIKDGRGTWTITDKGREALDHFPDAQELRDEMERLYNEWDEARQAEQRRAWLVRGSSVKGANIVHQWLEEGWVSVAASQLPPIEHGISLEDLTAAAQTGYSHLKHQELKSKVDEIVAFVQKMTPDDVVMATSEQQIYVGDVTGGWTWLASESGRSNLRRTVEWRNSDSPIDFADLPAPLPAKLASGANVVDLTAELALIDELTAPSSGGDSGEPGESVSQHVTLPDPSPALTDELFAAPEWLKEIRDLLAERKQVIFYGPPGTGKTYIARKLAADLVGPEQVKLVQFHPAYTYEDFFEGYRPADSDGGMVGFELKPGPLRQLVSRAIEHRDQAFVLIIDEINRANLAKVFGELYFLLEYRDEAVDLLYSSGDLPFTLPPNLYLIGTMNTVDRSIALVDSAMRRRFAFIALEPRVDPTRSLLRKWSAHFGLGPIAANLLEELNRRIDDPDFQIGPSYFMRRTEPDALSAERLGRIWATDILPLLEEHYYGQWPTFASRFSLASVMQASMPIGTSAPEEGAEGADAAETDEGGVGDPAALTPPDVPGPS
ncbi:MAG TPA: AAA family ATPase [Acidimicrobiales bacterium]|nr:AAA family ATPase [Acidimicrobiales bacterium]